MLNRRTIRGLTVVINDVANAKQKALNALFSKYQAFANFANGKKFLLKISSIFVKFVHCLQFVHYIKS